uniref:ATP synthase complex subunit 8 n=1 Tax=Creobroter elongata TaxID=1049645 RepID=A0A678RTR2_9NEOP|nr:ATP synthase F0 subunit 8 [Creobroter elongata]
MPQMMPLNWLTLFMFFSTMLILFNVLNYYVPYNKNTALPLTKMIIKTLTWKW